MRLPSSRVRRIIYNVGGGAAVLVTWVSPGPGIAAMSLAVLALLFLLAMLAGPEIPSDKVVLEPVCLEDLDMLTEHVEHSPVLHACSDDEMIWDDISDQYEWVCPNHGLLYC